ncbi:hypothetical protein RN001_012014 [Aquatica leii]|uniref:Odorant receptor n=1 Tax=Aquatica leii TaxID=1421715 RepID=A0AAN7P393_9COLE|nr:hypothetical protein RN001_012014 [Aquatica leii]
MEKTISNFKLEELKEKLRRRGLNTTGPKTELFNRMMANDPSGSWMYETDDDEINDDNDVRDVQKDCNGKPNCSFENITFGSIMVTSMYTKVVFLLNEDLYFDVHDALHFLMEKFKTHKYTEKAELVTRRITTLFTVYYSFCVLHYSVVPLIDNNNCRKRNNSDSALTCGLPTPESFPFKTTENPGYAIAYIFQVIACIVNLKSVLHPLMLSASIIYHIIGHLYMIQDDLTSLLKENINERIHKLKQILQHHSAVIELNRSICKALNHMLLMYTVMLAVIISVAGFQSTQVSTCAYNIEWYTESLEFQKMIKLVILRANNPLVVKSAFISDLSFTSFTKVVSTTSSYLTIMYNMMIVNDKKLGTI